MLDRNLDHFYELGDVYDTIETCDELEMRLGRLKRRHVLAQEEWEQTKSEVDAIRTQLTGHIDEVGLKPKGPRLP